MFLADPPVSRLVDLARRAEQAGFDYFWLNDASTHYEEPWPIFALIGEATDRIKIGPLVTNPVTRDWATLAGTIATLNEISGGRMVIGLGRGDIAVRASGKHAASVAETGRFAQTIRALVAGEGVDLGDATDVRIRWSPGWDLEVWGASYGPKASRMVGATCDGLILQSAAIELVQWVAARVAEGAREAGRDPSSLGLMVGAPAYVTTDLRAAHDNVRWFSTMVAEHVAELVRRIGDEVPPELASLGSQRVRREALDHAAGQDIPDELNFRNCLVGPAERHVESLRALEAVGVNCFTAYLSHDAPEQTIDAYGADVIPAWRERGSLQEILEELHSTTGASRVTLRQRPADGFFGVTHEVLGPGVPSVRDERTVDLRTNAVAQRASSGEQVVQDDCQAVSDDPEFRRMLAAYGDLAAQVVTPVYVGDSVGGLISVHQLETPRRWTAAELAACRAAADRVAAELQAGASSPAASPSHS
jgi:probable F420-dependent oxidoreductase